MSSANGAHIRELRGLPAGMFAFESIRREDRIYVDKTARLVELIKSCNRCFLSRPRRFGKSLTESTLEAMFSGRAELFDGLAAEQWVREQAKQPSPVLTLDMSELATTDIAAFNETLANRLEWMAEDAGVAQLSSKLNDDKFKELIRAAYKSGGPVVVLVDEYDKPMLDCIADTKKIAEVRAALRSFYTVLKACEKYLRFVMLTGISKFSKVGIFSAMNNLVDISMDSRFGDIVGYTQSELERYFSDWIDSAAERASTTRDDLLARIKDYYDGFCFDGETRLYNPFSTLCFLGEARFKNYWYTSGSPRWIVQYMKGHGINDPDEYRHIKVDIDFADSREIESARPESFLYQAGYLSIEKCDDDRLTLDYPNREVRESIYRTYLDEVWELAGATVISLDMRDAVRAGDVAECVRLFNTLLAGVSYEIYARERRDEAFYQLLFLIALRASGLEARGEVHGSVGRSDIEIVLQDLVVVLEFKFATDGREVDAKAAEGLAQIQERGYTRKHEDSGRRIISGVIVVNDEQRCAIYTGSNG